MKTRIILFLACTCLCVNAWAQRVIAPTESFSIKGKLENPMEVSLADLKKLPLQELGDIVIHNHEGKIKDTLMGAQGVPLRAVLDGVNISVEKPKFLSEFYFVFEASDGYTVVYSWNEIFNGRVGNEIYFLLGYDGMSYEALPGRIATISPTDILTGRRYVKGLQTIWVRHAE